MGQALFIKKDRDRRMYTARHSHAGNMDTDSDDVPNEDKRKCTPQKCKSCCKSFTAFLFSTVGLVIMVAAYSLAGGFLFQMLEEETEKKATEAGRDFVEKSTQNLTEKLWQVQFKFQFFYYENWTAQARLLIDEYQKDLHEATSLKGWDGRNDPEKIYTKWNFAGALLYAVTAITTIVVFVNVIVYYILGCGLSKLHKAISRQGYGHVTPKTFWGMTATMLYSLIGLPLTLMCIANLGKLFARIFRILYHTCCCGVCCICCLSWRKKRAQKKLAKEHLNDGSNMALEILGNGATMTITNDPNNPTKVAAPAIKLSKAQVWMMNVKRKFSHSMRDDVTVPTYLCLAVMAGYIMGGALLFSLWEGWNYIEGTYFCFVTLTTIGFGDFVPGIEWDPETATDEIRKEMMVRLILCALYVFFGLALIGMCIDLMQADVTQKIRWIAQKIGIISSDDKRSTEKPQKKASKVKYNIATAAGEIGQVDEDSAKRLGRSQSKYSEKSDSLNFEDEERPPAYEVHDVLDKGNQKKKKKPKKKSVAEANVQFEEVSVEPSPAKQSSSGTDQEDALLASSPTEPPGKGKKDKKKAEKPKADKKGKKVKVKVNPEPSVEDNTPKQKSAQMDNLEQLAVQISQIGTSPSSSPQLPAKHGATAATPSSYYDDLPNKEGTTPEHKRMLDVQTPPESPLNSNNNNSADEELLPNGIDNYHQPLLMSKSLTVFGSKHSEDQPVPGYGHLRRGKSESLTGSDLLDRILEDPVFLHTNMNNQNRRIKLYSDDFDDDDDRQLLTISRENNV